MMDWTTKYRPSGKKRHHLELFCSVENLLNARYREAQCLNESRLPGEPAAVTDIHCTPGNPRTFLIGGTVYL